jgi:hypothetical protein
VAALVALDAGAGWVDEHDAPTSFFRFAGEDVRELRPARIKDRLVEPGFRRGHIRQEGPGFAQVWLRCGPAGHPGCAEFFQDDHVA